MNILLVSSKVGRARHVSLHHRHVIVLLLVGLVYLPAFFTYIGVQIHDKLQAGYGLDGEVLAVQKHEVLKLRAELRKTRGRADSHLNALAQRMGHMQARLLRLDALGSRLIGMASIDSREFDFSSEPAVGGPSKANAPSEQMDIIASLDQLSDSLEEKAYHLAALEALMMDRQLTKAVTPSGWPVSGGWMSSRYGIRADPFSGRRSFHKGVDIASPMGSTIKTMGDGVVSYAGEKRGYGTLVEVTHGQGYVTRYAHASATLVKVGDRVAKGDPVAEVGTSGRSTGPHLHFEVLRNGKPADPINYLQNPRR
ncbi:MAG: M23 family metallopeptidase [Proteobacteria bacterium]|nr:M23 family metallopeptidase [Pseudomonadota bacterium]